MIEEATSQSSLMRRATSHNSRMRHATSQSSLMRHATSQSSLIATALNRDRDGSRTSWHKGNSSRMNRCIWDEFHGIFPRSVLSYVVAIPMGHGPGTRG